MLKLFVMTARLTITEKFPRLTFTLSQLFRGRDSIEFGIPVHRA
jgi:hypothetical protein